MPISYAITDDKKILFKDLPETEMFLAWGILTNQEMIKEQMPERFEDLKKKYPMPDDVEGNLHLVKNLMHFEIPVNDTPDSNVS